MINKVLTYTILPMAMAPNTLHIKWQIDQWNIFKEQ
jgi:hypothetical protein